MASSTQPLQPPILQELEQHVQNIQHYDASENAVPLSDTLASMLLLVPKFKAFITKQRIAVNDEISSESSFDLSLLLKGECDCLLWIAQLLADPNSSSATTTSASTFKKAGVYFKVAIGKYRALYDVSTDDERDCWLESLPTDTTKIITACKMSPSVLSALNGVVGEASSLVARATCRRKEAERRKEELAKKMEYNVDGLVDGSNDDDDDEGGDASYVDYLTALKIFSHLGNNMECLSILDTMAHMKRVQEDWVAAGQLYHTMIVKSQEIEQFQGMVEASENEALMCLCVAKNVTSVLERRRKREMQEEAAAAGGGGGGEKSGLLLRELESRLVLLPSYSWSFVDKKNEKERILVKYLRMAAACGKTCLDMCSMIAAQGLSSMLSSPSSNGGGVNISCLRTQSKVYQFAWEVATRRKGDSTLLATELLPLDNAKRCAEMAKECLVSALELVEEGKEKEKGGEEDAGEEEEGMNVGRTASMMMELGSIEAMLTNYEEAIVKYGMASNEFEKIGELRQRGLCVEMVKRLASAAASGGGGGGGVFSVVGEKESDAVQRENVLYVQDTEGVDSDDELGELGEIE